MGVIQMAFGASQILGLPAGLNLSYRWSWHTQFLAIAVFNVTGGLVIAMRLRPRNAHLAAPQESKALLHLWDAVAEPRYLVALAATALLTIGGYMLAPFLSAFTVHNLEIRFGRLPIIYLVTGLCTIVTAPLIGKATDAIGVPIAIFVNVPMFICIFLRMIPLC